MGGWDICAVPIVADPWINAGYGIICPSRPGYLRTPLTRYPVSTDEQADLMAALLDYLHVDKVVVTGGSAGGPAIYQFGIRYSHRVVALIPLVAISEAKPELPGTPMCCVDRRGDFPLFPAKVTTSFMTDATFGRLLYWLMQNVANSLTSGMIQMSSFSQEQREAEIRRVESNQTLKHAATMILLTTVTPFALRWPGNENDIYANTFVTLELEKITSPTLIVHDEFAGSNGVPLKYAEHAKRNIPNSELYIVPGAWHIVYLAEHWSDAMAKQIEFAKAAAAANGAAAARRGGIPSSRRPSRFAMENRTSELDMSR